MSKTLAPHPHTQSRLALSELAPGAMQSEIRAMTTDAIASAASIWRKASAIRLFPHR